MVIVASPSWSCSPATLSLPLTEIHLWCASLKQPLGVRESLWAVLSEDERSRAERYRLEHLQHYAVVSRGVLRLLLGQYLACAPATLCFGYELYGKPILVNSGLPQLAFNVTHSHELVLFAIASGCLVGVDAEYHRPVTQLEALIERYFSEQEQVDLKTCAPSERATRFLYYWTTKEALCKATGQGLQALTSVAVDLSGPRPAVVSIAGHASSDWQLDLFEPQQGYAGAIAYTAQQRPITFWRWNPVI